ncbi:MAG TPA: His-Xaa-Ser system radical SAM maturase HxsC [Thermoanaerobaculia bacterium]|nr:His-Xaa-Ser system radical SAM maturase HxsC [Thermoanaerobaculia bacterium]
MTASLPCEIDLRGYCGVLTCASIPPDQAEALARSASPIIHNIASLDHLQDGDVVSLSPTGSVRTLYRLASPHNSILVTERCNSFCVMCSQPPKSIDDSALIGRHLRLIELIDFNTKELGITGGEPTLLKADLLRLIERCKVLLPSTALHVLSNGRLFYYGSFARDLAAIGHPDLMIGIPLYSDIDWEHDHVVQAAGAFDQTLVGIQNLGQYGVPVEIRVVIHQHTYKRLPNLAEFIYRNLTFASHVALMGLEVMGFAVPNLSELWIDPVEYGTELAEATRFLANRGMNVSIYNHQLCAVPREIWEFCNRSISDWKNDYLPECEECVVRERCGGFFSSSLRHRHSSGIRPIRF